MTLPRTEMLPDHAPIDTLAVDVAIASMVTGQVAATCAVHGATAQIAQGARAMADTILSGGALQYAAAGSSGLMALADACELSGTFGLPAHRIRIHMAGGIPVGADMPGSTEDEIADIGIIVSGMTARDTLIVLSASGTTPYAIAMAKGAASTGARVIAIANNPDTDLLRIADIAICLETPPEPLAGSTRLGAGTAQKVALNAMSTQMAVHLGHVYCGMMVNLVADNAKLRLRACTIVEQIAGVGPEQALSALDLAGGHVKLAILIAAGLPKEAAQNLLDHNDGHLGPCLKTVEQNSN
jgi:N-acetylmuramic acid 6-phosphate etherase